jgi:hypothetical protein
MPPGAVASIGLRDGGGDVAADVELGYSDHPGEWDHRRRTDEVVVDVINLCSRRGRHPDPALVRALVERQWVEYADARVQTYLPVLIGRAVSAHVLRVVDASDTRHSPG